MLEGVDDYLQRRAAELGLDRASTLTTIQTQLDRAYPGQVRAVSLNQGVLKLVTPSAAVASELRLRQVELQKLFSVAIPPPQALKRVMIHIGTF